MTATLEQTATVVDVTYDCNATCRYCQWGNSRSQLVKHLRLQEILIPYESLKALGTKRIVLSGGEPRLHPQLSEILAYYSKYADALIILTNGYGLNRKEILRLKKLGATGITVSLDSIYSNESKETRGIPFNYHQKTISHLIEISKHKKEFEIGLNSVVSHITANWKTVKGILEFAQSLHLDFVKFQPIFTDGYVEQNAPSLMLSPSDYGSIMEICECLDTIEHPQTNPPEFWRNLGDLITGKRLSSRSCVLGKNQSIGIGKDLKICYWLKSGRFGKTNHIFSPNHVDTVRRSFEIEKLNCEVDSRCFCMQPISHVWAILFGSEKHG